MNNLDIAILVILGLSGFFACFRGFVRELLSLGGWVAASVGSVALQPFVLPWAESAMGEGQLATLGASAGAFVAILVVWTIISMIIAGRIRASSLSTLDRSLGLVFGLLRGSMLVILVYLFFTWLVPTSMRPAWVENAKMRPALDVLSQQIKNYIPQEMLESLSRVDEQESDDENDSKSELFDRLMDKKVTPDKNAVEKGYQDDAREDMDRLINSNIEVEDLPDTTE